MTVRLSDTLTPETVDALRQAIAVGRFPGVTLEHAILFARTDGIVPASDLPALSFLELEDWLRARSTS